jgi:acyl-CoA thioesterase I
VLAVPGWATADVCAVEDELLLQSAHQLPRVARHVAAGTPIRIVAIGSSSTEGVGATSIHNAYPAQLERRLRRLLPRNAVTVVNKGVGGQEAHDMLQRLQRDAIDAQADLVIWQSGTNSAIRDQDVGPFVEDLFIGIRRLQAAGIDVLLMGPQKSPRVDRAQQRAIYATHLHAVAETARVPYLPRYEVMAGWVAQGQMTMDEMIDPDGLHMTDLSYRCLGEATAKMIVNLSRAAVARQ